MNPEKQRIAIAEACGWKPDDDGAGLNTWEASWTGNKLYGLRPTFRPDKTISNYTVDCVVPDYLNDLNAMHEAEKVLTNEQLEVYCNILHKPNHGVYWAIHATAAQRAEAFLRTIGKWEDGK
jgi:hypothetical protein